MATLQKIRNKAGVLVATIIGLALLAFVLNDFIYSGNQGPSADDYELAEINGNPIIYPYFDQTVNELVENYKRNTGTDGLPDEATADGIREQAWEMIVQEYVLGPEYEELGIIVHADELTDLVQGNNIDPQVMQIPIFQNQETGMFDRNLVKQFILNMDQDPTGKARASWLSFEQQLYRNRLMTKYNTLIKKGLYVTNAEAKAAAEENSQLVDLRFVMKRYTDINDSSMTVTDAELKKYYDEHMYLFERDATRDVEYVVFDIVPSEDDKKEVFDRITVLKMDFEKSPAPVDFVNFNSENAYVDRYYSKGELMPEVDSIIFAADTGFVIGPYNEANVMRLARVIKVHSIPDSVHARHILIQPNEQRSPEVVKVMADSIKNLIDKGADFKELAMKYSDDKGSAVEGGDLKWFPLNAMVRPFEKACFEGKKGDVVIVESQFGIHIIEILEQGPGTKRLEIAFVDMVVQPGNESTQAVYSMANEFAGNMSPEAFNKAVESKGYVKRIASNLRESDRQIAGLDSPRELVRWAFGAEKGTVSQVYQFGDKYVVAIVTNVVEKGIAPLEAVKEEVTTIVKKEKKAEQFIAEMSSATSLDDLALKLNLTAQDAAGITFGSFSMPGVGIEPVVIATAALAQKDKLSKPIKGNNGVFVFVVTNQVKNEVTDYSMEKMRMMAEVSSRVDYQAYEALKKSADIKDYRIKFF